MEALILIALWATWVLVSRSIEAVKREPWPDMHLAPGFSAEGGGWKRSRERDASGVPEINLWFPSLEDRRRGERYVLETSTGRTKTFYTSPEAISWCRLHGREAVLHGGGTTDTRKTLMGIPVRRLRAYVKSDYGPYWRSKADLVTWIADSVTASDMVIADWLKEKRR